MIDFLPSPYSAWFQVSEGSDTVSVMLKTKESELVRGGQVIAKHGCWTLLKGGIAANFSGPVEILFEVKHILDLYLPFFQQQNLYRDPNETLDSYQQPKT